MGGIGMSSIRYRTNPKSRKNGEGTLTPKQLALVKERLAYEQQLDVKRRELLPEDHADRADLEEAKTNADEARLFALIAARATKCSPEDIKAVRLETVENWLQRLESSHLALAEIVKECDAVLNAGAKSTLSKKERDEVAKKRADISRRVTDIEISHEVATAALDKLKRGPKKTVKAKTKK